MFFLFFIFFYQNMYTAAKKIQSLEVDLKNSWEKKNRKKSKYNVRYI